MPALVYWYLEENYPVKIAAAAGVGLAIIEVIAEKIFLKHVHKISIFNLILLSILGGLSVFAGEGIWFKLQPGFTGALIGGLLLSSKWRKKSFFKEMMDDLKIRKETDDDAEYKNKLNTMRTQIDVIDASLLESLSKRMKIANGIGELKKSHNVAVLQSKRWNEILGKMILDGDERGLSEEFILRIFKAIHQESINHQEKIINA